MKLMKKITSIFLATLLALSALAVVPFTASAADSQLVVEGDTYYVGSAAALQELYALCTDNNADFAGKTILLTNDIDLTGVTLDPTYVEIAGVFDGQGHAIKNFTATVAGSYGFVDYVTGGGVMKNIRFLNASFTKSAGHAAFISRASNAATFENIYLQGTVNVTKAGGSFGGFVGQAYSTNFVNCVSDITHTGTSVIVGGFVGIPNVPATINFTDCAFIGDLSGSAGGSAGFVCNISVATSQSNFVRCVSAGKLSDASTACPGFAYIGALTSGTHQISLTDCYMADQNRFPVLAASKNTVSKVVVTFTQGTEDVADDIKATSPGIADGETTLVGTGGAEQFALRDLFNTNSTLGIQTQTHTDVDLKAAKNAPLANNGWMVLEGETQAYRSAAKGGNTITKILPKTVVALQDDATVKVAFVQANETGSAIRFVNAVAGLEALNAFDAVGYEVTVAEEGVEDPLLNAKQVSTTKLLTSITADGLSKTVAELNADNEGLNADYLVALSLNGFKTDGTAYTVTVKPFVQSGDMILYGTAVTGTVVNGVFTQA